MRKKLNLNLLFFILGFSLIQKSSAQNISVDMNSIQNEYPADFSNGFKISFKNAKRGDKTRVSIKKDDGTPAILKQDADLTNYTIEFTPAEGMILVKDKDDKDIKIAKDKFEIDLGAKPVIVIRSNDISVDLSNINKNGYKTDFTRDFKIIFRKGKAGDQKKVTIGQKPDEQTAILNSKADLTKYEIKFIYDEDSKTLIVKDEKDKDFKIEESPFSISLDGKITINISNSNDEVSTEPVKETGDQKEKEKIPYWSYLKDNHLEFSLDEYRLISTNNATCCDDCPDCDNDAFVNNNRIIYDARSGVTYFIPEDISVDGKLCGGSIKNYKDYKVNHKNKIRLSAGDPLVFTIENVNPALYNIELSDSSFLTNNETTALLESLLLQKSENALSSTGDVAKVQAGNDQKINKEKNEKIYFAVKTGLLIVRSEMWMLLENLRLSSPYLHNCIQEKKREALSKINGYPTTLLNGLYKDFSFIQLVDAFLNQETEDSTLNHQIKALYGEFVAASYKIAYRYPQIPEQDILNFKLSITAKPNSPYPGLLNVQMKHPTQTVYIKNFFKADVSSGLYMGFMKDQTYALQPDTLSVRNTANTGDSLTNIKRIVREDDGKNEIGFASFLHLYYKYSRWFNIGGTLGAGISFDKTVRPRYFTGISLLIGHNNRVCINGGLVWGNYEDLSNQYKKTVNNYNPLKDTETSLNYATKFKHKGFISISYNLPFLVRKGKTDAKPKDDSGSKTEDTKTTSAEK